MTLANTHVVIVGGTKGIGRATAVEAVAAGARVTATGHGAASLASLPEGAEGAVLDFTDSASVAALVEGIGRSTSWCCRPLMPLPGGRLPR